MQIRFFFFCPVLALTQAAHAEVGLSEPTFEPSEAGVPGPTFDPETLVHCTWSYTTSLLTIGSRCFAKRDEAQLEIIKYINRRFEDYMVRNALPDLSIEELERQRQSIIRQTIAKLPVADDGICIVDDWVKRMYSDVVPGMVPNMEKAAKVTDDALTIDRPVSMIPTCD